MSDISIKRGKLIKKAREKMGLKQADVAKLLGKTVSAISSYELGTRNPKFDDAILLCKVLKIDIAKMIG